MENNLILEGIDALSAAKEITRKSSVPISSAGSHDNHDNDKEQLWKWSGTDFIKSPTQEPWVFNL